ncbi:MAG: BrnT family toxin [Candidatus Binatia bacterium]
MQFEWDRKKAANNFRKHKVSFDEAVTVFYDPLSATFNDPEHSIGEERYISIGYSSTRRLLVVSYSERDDGIRIISARRANTKEKRRHET